MNYDLAAVANNESNVEPALSAVSRSNAIQQILDSENQGEGSYFPERLRAAIVYNITQKGFAGGVQAYLTKLIISTGEVNDAGKARAMASQYMASLKRPKPTILNGIADGLGVNPAWLDNGDLPICLHDLSDDTQGMPPTGDPYWDTIGGRLTQLCIKHGTEKADIISLTTAGRSTVYKWFTNKAEPGIRDLLALSQHFKVSLDHIVKGEENCFPANSNDQTPEPLVREVSAEELTSFIQAKQNISDILPKFDLKIHGDHLFWPNSANSIPSGAVLHVKTAWENLPAGKVVVVALREGQFIETGVYSLFAGAAKLTPINKIYEAYEMTNEDKVIGVVTSYTLALE